MLFVTADNCRSQLERLSQMLVSSFPGSTIYQHTDLLHVLHDVLNHKVDAVLLGAETENSETLDLMEKLHRQKPELPIFIISKTNSLYEKAVAAGAAGCFVLPDKEPSLLEAIRSAINKKQVS
ncbi:MAG: hypothetical protein IKU12_03485 [Oscillospiraceae bacterium]|nr:hypothetical protein [Oscillospiraceae bacterium]